MFNASTREEHQPNSRHQFDNVFTLGKSGLGGEHLFKAGVQWGRLYYGSDYSVQGDHWLVYNNGVPTSVRQFNSPAFSKNIAKVTGFFVQDSWSMNRLTLNLGGRCDKYVGTLPEQSAPGGRFVAAAHGCRDGSDQPEHRACGALGASYDLTGSGRTALKASYSRYGLQVGIDRVTNVNPLTVGIARLPVDRPERQPPVPRVGEINVAQCPALQRRRRRPTTRRGVDWPYSDEVTAGVETQLPGAVRVGAMFYYRTNREQIGQVNTLQPTSAYTPHTITIPNGPGGTVANPKPTTATVYNISPALASATDERARQRRLPRHRLQGRRVHRHQALLAEVADAGGLHHRQERGRRQPTARPNDLNDPNNTLLPDGHHRQRLGDGVPPVGQLRACRGTSTSPGSMIANNGYPYVSTYSLTRAARPRRRASR